MKALLIALARSLTLNASAFAGITTANFGATVLDGATSCAATTDALDKHVRPSSDCPASSQANF